jgi:hypothetical protein
LYLLHNRDHCHIFTTQTSSTFRSVAGVHHFDGRSGATNAAMRRIRTALTLH